MTTDTTKMVEFNAGKAKLFVTAYNKARQAGATQFTFEGNDYVIDYAYYLIQYLTANNLLRGNFYGNKIFNIKNLANANR